MDKTKIYCSEDIHKIDYDYLNVNINDIKNNSFSFYEMKATYFCMECLRPFCSDCILKYKIKHKNNNNNIINDDNNDNKDNLNNDNLFKKNIHIFNHPIFKIELLKDAGIFDLLYEKGKSKKIISDIELIEQNIKEKIENLNSKKKNMISFLDYIKNIYIVKIDEIINNLISINKEKDKKLNIIKEKSQELSNFLHILKTQKDLKNQENINKIKYLLTDFNSFHKIPYEIKKNASKFMKFKGIINLEEHFNLYLNINLKEPLIRNINLNNAEIIIKYNIFDNNIQYLEEDNNIKENNNKIIEEKKVLIIYKQKKNKSKKENENEINDYYSYPILFNNNQINEFIVFKDIQNDININKKNNLINDNELNGLNNFTFDLNFSDDDDDDDDSFIGNLFKTKKSKKNDFNNDSKNDIEYYGKINIECLKKLNNDNHNMNFDIYKLNLL